MALVQSYNTWKEGIESPLLCLSTGKMKSALGLESGLVPVPVGPSSIRIFPNHTERSKRKAVLTFSQQKWRGLEIARKAPLTLNWHLILLFYIWERPSLLTGDSSQCFMLPRLLISATHVLSYPSYRPLSVLSTHPSTPTTSSCVQHINSFPIAPDYYYEKFNLTKNQDETNISIFVVQLPKNHCDSL